MSPVSLGSGPQILSGLLADRPAAAGVGDQFFATDELGGTLYRWTGSAWDVMAPRGAQLLSLERTATNVVVSSPTPADVSGVSGVVTSRGRPLEVSWGFGVVQCGTGGQAAILSLWEDVSDDGSFVQIGSIFASNGGANGYCSSGSEIRHRAAQAAGTLIRYKLMAACSSGTATYTVSAVFPISLQVKEV